MAAPTAPREVKLLGPPYRLGKTLKQHRNRDGGDQRGKARRRPQRAVGDLLDHYAHQDDAQDGDRTGQEDRQPGHGHIHAEQRGAGQHQCYRQERAEHEQLAEGEVDEANHSVDERVCDSRQRIDCTQHKAVGEQLAEEDHAVSFVDRRLSGGQDGQHPSAQADAGHRDARRPASRQLETGANLPSMIFRK